MTSHALRQNAAQTAQAIALAPVLLAALIGVIPLLIPCIACRCCTALFASLMEAVRR
jgi:hypothetical protein